MSNFKFVWPGLMLSCAVFLSACSFFIPDDFFNPARRDTFNQGLIAFDGGNYKSALESLKTAADEGDVDAQYMTGLIYAQGLTGKTNLHQAEKYFSMSAEEGHLPSQIQLAYLYADSSTPLYSPERAYKWFSIVCEERPEYEPQLGRMRWAIQNKAAFVKPQANRPSYKGVDYNHLFPPR